MCCIELNNQTSKHIYGINILQQQTLDLGLHCATELEYQDADAVELKQFHAMYRTILSTLEPHILTSRFGITCRLCVHWLVKQALALGADLIKTHGG